MSISNKNVEYWEKYIKNFYPNHNETAYSTQKKIEKILEEPNFSKYSSESLIFSIIYNVVFLIIQIIGFKTQIGKTAETYLATGLLICFIILFLVGFILKQKKRLKINFDYLIFLSYAFIFIAIVTITFLPYFKKEVAPSYDIFIYMGDYYLIISCFLMILSCECEFILRHKILIIIYFFSIIGLILFREIMTNNSQITISLLASFAMFFYILLVAKKKSDHLKKKCLETSTNNLRIFYQLDLITNVLDAGIFLFKKEELFYSNETGQKILKDVSAMPPYRISCDSNQTPFKEFKPSTEIADLKNYGSDSIANLNSSYCEIRFPLSIDNKIRNLTEHEEVLSLFEKVTLYEDTSKIHKILTKLHTEKASSDREEKLENKITSINDLDREEAKLNLNSIYSSLNESPSNCLVQFKEYFKLGIFKLNSSREQETYFQIIVKVHNCLSRDYPEDKVIEFIFKDVTVQYNLLGKIQEENLNFKKNAHEFKTPILSLLGCAEELKANINQVEDLLPKSEKIKINNCLDHVTNLSSYTGYLIRGLTNAKDGLKKSNSVAEYKPIKLNPLLNFSFKILQTLISCNSQKFKHVKTELINDLIDCDFSFDSDEIQVKQILLNFISNAVKFTNNGSIALEAKLNKEDKNDVLEIAVKDSGCGVKEKDRKKLFGEYAKFNNTENNDFGSGLGLNICKTMADNLNMKIDFNSEENKGTKVSLIIFNPVINLKEKVDESTKMRMNDDGNEMEEEIMFKKTFGNKNKFLSRIQNKETRTDGSNILRSPPLVILNEESHESNDEYFEKSNQSSTLINPTMAELHRSQFSCILNSSLISEIDSPEKTPTRRSDKNHKYDFIKNYKNEHLEEKLNYNFNKISTEQISSSSLPFLSVNNVPEYIHMATIVNQEIMRSNSLGSLINEKKLIFSKKSSQSFLTMKSNINESLLREKILIVDDQLHSRRALVNITTKYCRENNLDYDILDESDGIDCLKTIINYPFNVRYVFIDENMNYMNGTETAGIIKKLSLFGKIGKVILILTSADDIVQCQSNVFDFCVTKPLVRKNIEEVLKKK